MARALLLALLSAALAVGVASADEAPVTTQDADVVPADVFPPLGFFPQAGVLWQDLFVASFVDLDPAPGAAKDFDCGSQVYDGHGGEDSLVRSFREHAIAHGSGFETVYGHPKRGVGTRARFRSGRSSTTGSTSTGRGASSSGSSSAGRRS